MKALKILLVMLLLTLANRSLASHAAGGYFRYTCLGNNDYQVDYYFLRDCSGNDAPNGVVFWLTNSCQTPNCWPLDGYIAPRVSLETANYGCGANCDEDDNTPPTFQWAKFSRVITLPYACADWTISVSIQARNTVAFCEAPNSPNYYNYCKINNTNGLCNSSLAYTGYPLALGCAGDMGTSVYGWTNPDGSTIQAEFVYPQAGECNAHYDMTFVGGATVVRPYPAAADFDFSTTSGQFDFQPLNAIGNSYFAVKYTEYDANGTYLGETVVDGMIYISNECEQTSPITFSDWFFDDDNTLYVNGTGELCGELHLTPNDSDEHVTSISISGLPDYMSYSYEYNSDGTANVTVCGEWPVEYLCQEVDIPFVVEAVSSGDDCLSQVTGSGWEGHYHMVKERGDYCPENLYFTNRNSTSGNIMPLTARAEDRIWVGDNMPAAYDPQTEGLEGAVTVPDGGYYTAGIEIILPSCDVGNGCVTLEGSITLEIAPGSCSAECYREPLDVTVKEIFKCSHERLEVFATGEGPFTYQLIILGDTITASSASFFIHDIISEQDNGQVPYTINVYDAIGDSGTFSGFILGTKRFYEPILDNKFYSIYADNNPSGPTGWYYGANLGVYSGTPAYFTDSVNTSPPWYGATDMWLIVWDRWGIPAVNIRHDLQLQPDGSGGEDWSLNQGEFYWTGKLNNGIWADCFENTETMFFNYTLKARNCYDDQNMDLFVQGMDEASTVILFSCTDDDPWHPVETKSAQIGGDDNNDYAESQELTGISRVPEIGTENYLEVSISPNPANEEFTIISDYDELYNVTLTDQSGKVVVSKGIVKKDEKINVSSLGSGLYTLRVETSDFVKQFKVVII